MYLAIIVIMIIALAIEKIVSHILSSLSAHATMMMMIKIMPNQHKVLFNKRQ